MVTRGMSLPVIELVQHLAKNELFVALFGGSLVGAVLYVLRNVPAQLWNFAKWRFLAQVVVYSDDRAFDAVSEWLVDLEYSKRCRQLRLSTLWRWEDDSCHATTPGIGYHLIRHDGRYLVLYREVTEKAGNIFGRSEELRLIVPVWRGGAQYLRQLLAQVTSTSDAAAKQVQVFIYRSHWRKVAKKAVRSVHTVVLARGLAQTILNDVDTFKQRSAWYAHRGIPYRRAYMFEGPPGTGKTSFAIALAGHYGRPIYALNLASIANDDELVAATITVPSNGIMLIEDIDAAKVTADREVATTAPSDPNKPPEKVGITLSGLLNALDGTFTREGRIVIMTTNHPEKLDPALLRPGRCDARYHFALHGYEEAVLMAVQFGLKREDAITQLPLWGLPIAPAVLQERLIQFEDELGTEPRGSVAKETTP